MKKKHCISKISSIFVFSKKKQKVTNNSSKIIINSLKKNKNDKHNSKFRKKINLRIQQTK